MEKYLANIRYSESTIVKKRLFKMDDESWYRLARECGGFVVLSFPQPYPTRYIPKNEEYVEPKKLPEVYVTFQHDREHDLVDLEENLKSNSFGFIEVLGGFDAETNKPDDFKYISLLIPYASFENIDTYGHVRYKRGEDSKDGALEFVLKLQSLARKYHFYHMVVCMPQYFEKEAVSFNTYHVDNPYPVLDGEDELNQGYPLEDVCHYYRTIVTFNDGASYGVYLSRGNLEAVSYFDENDVEVDLFGNRIETEKERKHREKKEKKEEAKRLKAQAKENK